MADTINGIAYPLAWDQVGEKLYETGTDRGVVYPYDSSAKAYGNGVNWNGLTGFTDSPSGADETALWADNMKYVAMRAAEEYGGTITAYTYPDAFAECDGSAVIENTGISFGQQKRKTFGFSCRTLVGNDTELNDYGYKIHLVWGATVSPSDKDYATVNDSPDAIEFSWEFTTTPTAVGTAYKPTAHMTLDTSKMDQTAKGHLTELEAILYGTASGGLLVMTGSDEPAQWPDDATPSTKYFKLTGCTSSDSYVTNTFYKASGNGTYVKVTGSQPEDWPSTGAASTTYFKATGVTSSDVYAANTYYEAGPTPARLPSPAEVITLFGGSPNVAG